MPTISQQQLQQLEQDEMWMKKSGLSQGDIDAYREERLAGWGITLPASTVTPQETIRTLAMTGGAVTGGLAAPTIARALVPKAVNMLTRPLIAGGGEAIGQFIGDVATGGDIKSAATGALATGAIGGGTQLGANLTTYGLGRIGGVEGNVLRETIARGPVAGGRLAIGHPAHDAELQLAEKLQAQLRPPTIEPGSFRRPNLVEKTPARLRAESKMERFDAREQGPTDPNYLTGVDRPHGAIETGPIRDRILSMVRPNSLETGQMAVNSYLTDLANRLPQRMTMQELDQFIVEHSKPLSAKFGVQQIPLPQGAKVKILGAARAVRNKALPESKADFSRASRQLASMRSVAKRMLTPTGEVKDSAIGSFKGFLKNQRLRQVMEVYEKETGNRIIQEADDLAMKRQWTRDDSKRAGYIWYLIEAFGSRPAAKVGVVASQPLGVGAAAYSAFSQAMENP